MRAGTGRGRKQPGEEEDSSTQRNEGETERVESRERETGKERKEESYGGLKGNEDKSTEEEDMEAGRAVGGWKSSTG